MDDLRIEAAQTESGLIVPADAIVNEEQELDDTLMTQAEREAAAHLEDMRKRVEEFNAELEKLDPMSRLLRKLDILLMQWLPQQPEWVMLLGENREVRRNVGKVLAKAIVKRLTAIPYSRRGIH